MVRYYTGGYGIHEVYYDDDGNETAMTEEPATFISHESDEVLESIKMAMDDAHSRPIFHEPKEWFKK